MARPGIAASPLADRVDLVGGSFFERVPPADLYTLKQILHDWDDSECVQILESIRASMPATRTTPEPTGWIALSLANAPLRPSPQQPRDARRATGPR